MTPKTDLQLSDLVYDWNKPRATLPRRRIQFDDETLRDGLQGASVRQPSIEERLTILHAIVALGIEGVDIGLPGGGPTIAAHTLRLAQEVAHCRLNISVNCAGRTHPNDVAAIARIQQACGLPMEAALFIGSSKIRQLVSAWDMADLLRLVTEAIDMAVREGLSPMFVTEDTTRTDPGTTAKLYRAAIEHGARRVVIADTVGHITPAGTRRLVRFVRQLVDEIDPTVQIDWHGHRDRDLAVANALTAYEAGADRLHGAGIGIGERAGNCPMEALLVNAQICGYDRRDLTSLPHYARLVSEATGMPISANFPIVGHDAFETSTGVHADAVHKATQLGAPWLMDAVYSGVPAAMVGRQQVITIGPQSGMRCVEAYLAQNSLTATPRQMQHIFTAAKAGDHVLSLTEVRDLLEAVE